MIMPKGSELPTYEVCEVAMFGIGIMVLRRYNIPALGPFEILH